MDSYDVTVRYGPPFPPFSCRVFAKDEAHAQRIALYEATARGWPHFPIEYETRKLK